MKTRLRVTVEGKAYDVLVETLEDLAPRAAPPVANKVMAAPVAAAPAPAPVSIPAPAPAPAAAPPVRRAAVPGDVPTPLAGLVVEVLVKPGQAVKEDEPLLILEAMKMRTPIPAPRDGAVTELLVHPGQQVIEGEVIARMA
jgi:biotin carboxyl carrier protein